MQQNMNIFLMFKNLDDKAEYIPCGNVTSFVYQNELQTKLKITGGLEILCNTPCHVIEARLNAFYNQFIPKP